jgi:excisionase family DNA binding protein
MSDNTATRPELLTIPEAADILRVPHSWLYTATRNGFFPCVRNGKYVRIRSADVDAWIASGGQGSDDEE